MMSNYSSLEHIFRLVNLGFRRRVNMEKLEIPLGA